MKQNPLEQPKIDKINSVREEVRGEIERAFDNHDLASKLGKLILKLDLYQQQGLVFDKEAIC